MVSVDLQRKPRKPSGSIPAGRRVIVILSRLDHRSGFRPHFDQDSPCKQEQNQADPGKRRSISLRARLS